MACRGWLLIAILLIPTAGFGLPSGFTDSVFVNGLGGDATAMSFAPDGRLFVLQQSGSVRIVTAGQLLPTPFMTLTVNSVGERGLLGIAFDPGFASNRFVYLYYTAPSPAIHNRVSRFTASAANPNVVEPGSELALIDFENLSASNHNGGALHFGLDGKLYIAVGENAVPSNSSNLANRLGKIHRINPDGSIPPDNPFVATSGAIASIWAYGFRNPFTFAVQPGTGRIYVNDVGEGAYEEINELTAGGFYGWPSQEGPNASQGLSYVAPVFSYPHVSGPISGCSIIGGAFYNPAVSQFPLSYTGQYFFGDLCGGWLRSLTTANAPVDFATGYSSPVAFELGPDGALYVLARGSAAVRRISYASPQPLSATPASGAGKTQVFAFQFSDPRGWQDLGIVNVLINKFIDGRDACYIAYSQPANMLFLVNDAGSALLPGLVLDGSPGSTSNSQCTINRPSSSASGTGNTLTLTLDITFSQSFEGDRALYLAARDTLQSNSGWLALGAWRVAGCGPSEPSVTGLTPARVVGATQTMTFTFTDAAGATDLGIANVLIRHFLDGRNSCYLAYSRPLNTLFLVSDDGGVLLPGVTPGSGSVSNSQCTLTGAGSSAVAIGNDLTLTLNLTMSAAYSGDKVIWAAARSLAEETAGWQPVGSWTAP